MKKSYLPFTFIVIFLAIALLGCPAPGPTVYAAGDQQTFTADAVSFKLFYVPGKTFPTGTNDLGAPATVASAYWIGETEVTYELWNTVYTWANVNGYTFANAGFLGNDGIGSVQQPVTYVNWRDCMVWCNAATEWYNAKVGTWYGCVYKDVGTPIRNSTDGNGAQCDAVTPDASAKGFRLLSSNEWEAAARWRNDATNTVAGYSNPYFTKGNSASGAYTYCYNTADTNPANGVVDGKDANDIVAVYYSYWNGSWVETGVTGTAEVKSKGTNGANSLGLYDMSGNVWEWCFDLSGSERVERGGAWNCAADAMQVGYWLDYNPVSAFGSLGFRLARTP